MRLTVGPSGTFSAAAYHLASWLGQKYGWLNTSCRQSTCTPFLPASSISGRCASFMRSRIACGLSPVSAFKAIWISPALTIAMSSPPSVFSPVPAPEQDFTRRSGSLARAHVLKTGYRKLDPNTEEQRVGQEVVSQ